MEDQFQVEALLTKLSSKVELNVAPSVDSMIATKYGVAKQLPHGYPPKDFTKL